MVPRGHLSNSEDLATLGSVSEMSTDGGELAFVTRMIEESKTKAALVRIYTTMVGHKYNLKRLEQVLKSLRCPRWTATEFCQGRTMRWGLAWSWDAKCPLDKAPPPLRPSKISTIKPIVHEVKENPSLFVYTVPAVYDFLTNALIRISLALDEKVRSDLVAKTDFYARDNTWSGQRKKKREKLRAKEGQAQGEPAKERLSAESLQDLSPARSSSLGGKKRVRGALEAEEDEDSAMASPSKRPREGLEEDFDAMFDSCSSALPTPPEYLVHGRLVVKRQGGRIHLELSYLEGNGGKEAVAQIQQFLKNHLSGVYAAAGGVEKADTAMEVYATAGGGEKADTAMEVE
ncbi:unnamed protein product [Cyprideis torosa]|uniref:Uncharacterized protein n=1 Tax=Cyprideis torosa TaxID=163714 RepID=A0A7R8WCF7_9CRUS|nr:unnamed protein product [Cyprideis torosa]CAG0892008.1 unnamed protein product [Cyprideis torosa]